MHIYYRKSTINCKYKMIIKIWYAIQKIKVYIQQNTASILADIQCYTYQIHIILICRNRFKLVKSQIRVLKSLFDERISTKSTHNANDCEYIPSYPVHSCLGYDEISDTIQVGLRQRISQELILLRSDSETDSRRPGQSVLSTSVLEFGFVKSAQYYHYS